MKKADILVIDDEKNIRDGCQQILSTQGWNVVTTDNGSEGIEMVRNESFDIVLLDLKMPGISGVDIMNAIQQIDTEILVIIITGYATVESAVEVMKGGAYDFVSKPFTTDQLIIVVRRALEKQSLRRAAKRLEEEKEQTLQDLDTEKSRILTVINSMADGVVVTDPETKVVLHNPSALRLFGTDAVSMTGTSICDHITDERLAKNIRKALDLKSDDFSGFSLEFEPQSPKDTYLRAHTAPVRNEEGRLVGSVTVLQDITPLKELDKMKNEFVAMVSHELRSPITSIIQQISSVRGGLAGDLQPKQKAILDVVVEKGNELLTLISNLLDLAKIEAGQTIQEKVKLMLPLLLQDLIDFMKANAEAKGVNLVLESMEAVPPIEADPGGMERVFSNLLSNAIKYTPEGGLVRVVVRRQGQYIEVIVNDNGVGIDPKDLPNIFDKFFRVRGEKTRHVTGSGLGLSIVKGIVGAHFGAIDVESTSGEGSRFKVLLPACLQ